ncbi:Ig-like domain-containing protein, partial [Undibacterium rugosum]|uniref:Ig-like domain-containing protein n=1 Tax=Undibacterium rugosum TaxID=2762291 RepID=UPI001B8225BF
MRAFAESHRSQFFLVWLWPLVGSFFAANFARRLTILLILVCSQLFFTNTASAACSLSFSVAQNSVNNRYTLSNAEMAACDSAPGAPFGLYVNNRCDTGTAVTTHGSVTLLSDVLDNIHDSFLYTPTANYSGPDTVTFYTTTDGATCTARTANVTVTSSGPPVPVLTFTTPTSASVVMGNSLTNAATSTLTGGSYGMISYSSANSAVATVSVSGVITPVSAGTVVITATQAAV